MSIDLDAYFRRIEYGGRAAPSLETLRAIQARHVDAIPFENLSAFIGEPIALDAASLQAKLLRPGRGGWCFEQNLLFAHVLEAIGFRIRRLAARVRWNVAPSVTTPRSHMLLEVDVRGRDYIADVGFGGLTLSAPLKLEAGIEQATPHEPHRVISEEGRYTLEAFIAGSWQALYVFDRHEQQLADYEVTNWYLANHPQSQFVKGIVAARAAPGVRHALRNTRYAVHHRGGETERRFITDVAEYKRLLREAFRIEVPQVPGLDEKLRRMIEANPPDSPSPRPSP